MKKYNFQKAKSIIEQNKELLQSAALGMHEDWFWTAIDVFEDGEFTTDLDTATEIAGLDGSSWATPVLQLNFKDGTEKMLPCHDLGESSARTISGYLGCLSGPMQENITPIFED